MNARRLVGRLHLWIGLILCAPLVPLGLSGSLLVLVDTWNASSTSAETQPENGRTIAEIVEAARKAAPAGTMPSLYVAPGVRDTYASVRLSPGKKSDAPAHGIQLHVDPVSLRIIDEPSGGMQRWLHAFHASLLLNNEDGRPIVGALGVAMLLLGVSGLVNWWPRAGSWGAAFRVRPNARGLILYRDLHGAAGIWALLIFIAVSFSGTYLAFPKTVGAMIAAVLPTRDLRVETAGRRVVPLEKVAPLGVDAAVALARTGTPQARLLYVAFPTRRDQPFRIALARSGDKRGAPPLVILVDQWQRRVAARLDPDDMSMGESLIAWQHAIHSGNGLGGVWRIAVFAVGLLPLGFAITGIAMWWRKRRPIPLAHRPLGDSLQSARSAER